MTTFSDVRYLDGAAVASLRSVFRSTLIERDLAPGCDAAEDLAATIMRLYLAGVTEMDELLQRVRVAQAA